VTFEFISYCCCYYSADQSLLRTILDKYQQSKNGILLNAILSSVQPQFICDNASKIIEYIKQTDPETFPRVSRRRHFLHTFNLIILHFLCYIPYLTVF
jgi:hypothetical protein